jgi:hypothetical protein
LCRHSKLTGGETWWKAQLLPQPSPASLKVASESIYRLRSINLFGGDSKMLNTRPSSQASTNLRSTNRNPGFREAKRIQQSLLANLEKRTLIWLAARMPAWINSDHLTLLGLFSMAAAGAAYWWSARNRLGLVLVVVCLALNWLGD